MKLVQLILMLTAWLCATTPCVAGPPYNVDDPGTATKRTYEINAAYVSSSTTGYEDEELPNVEVNYGYTNNLQLTIDPGTTSQRFENESRRSGIDDTGLEVKWRFMEEAANRPQLAFDCRIKVPTASEPEDLGTGHVDAAPEIIAAKTYRSLYVFSNAGVSFIGENGVETGVFYGMAASYNVTERVSIGAQVYGNTAEYPLNSDFNYGLALEDTYVPNRTLMLAIGRSADGQSNLNVYAGLQLVLGPRSALEQK